MYFILVENYGKPINNMPKISETTPAEGNNCHIIDTAVLWRVRGNSPPRPPLKYKSSMNISIKLRKTTLKDLQNV